MEKFADQQNLDLSYTCHKEVLMPRRNRLPYTRPGLCIASMARTWTLNWRVSLTPERVLNEHCYRILEQEEEDDGDLDENVDDLAKMAQRSAQGGRLYPPGGRITVLKARTHAAFYRNQEWRPMGATTIPSGNRLVQQGVARKRNRPRTAVAVTYLKGADFVSSGHRALGDTSEGRLPGRGKQEF